MTESKLRRRTDGRLDRSRDPAILNAALAALKKHGYDAANMNDIATQAGVGKAAIYRRWSSKAALMTDVLLYWRPDLLDTDAPNDTGSLLGDLDALVEKVRRDADALVSNELILRVAMEAARDPELASALDDLMLLRGRRMMTIILGRAAERGEIADRDWSLVTDVMTGMGLLQVIHCQSVDAGFVRRVIDALVLPALAAPDARQTFTSPVPSR